MAVVLLSFFDPEEVPGILLWRLFPKSDVLSYKEIWESVQKIANFCISPFLATNDTLGSCDLDFVSETG